jgi:hypothetical protein
MNRMTNTDGFRALESLIHVATFPDVEWLATIDIREVSTVIGVKLALQGVHGIQVDQIRCILFS